MFSFLAKQFLDRKDPCIETAYAAPVVQARQVPESAVAMINNEKVEEGSKLIKQKKDQKNQRSIRAKSTRYIPIKIKQQIFKRDQCCQWTQETINAIGEITKTKCGSKFQLQIDHIKPKWQDGANDQGNLQLLCAAHNKLKYQLEVIG